MVDRNFVYKRIGMALVSAQRVEFITGELVKYLYEFDQDLFGITSKEFLSTSIKSIHARMTLGKIFTQMKLIPILIIEDELNDYLAKRNILVHEFWKNYLDSISEEQAKRAVEFCNEFGRISYCMERFFKGLIFLLELRFVEERSKITDEKKIMDADFEYFLKAINERHF